MCLNDNGPRMVEIIGKNVLCVIAKLHVQNRKKSDLLEEGATDNASSGIPANFRVAVISFFPVHTELYSISKGDNRAIRNDED